MPKVEQEVPEKLKPYLFLGLDLGYNSSDKNAVGECPFCGRPKFSVVVQTGEWRCLICNIGDEKGKTVKGGNTYTFIRLLHQLSLAGTNISDLDELANNRKIMFGESLKTWGACRSIISRDWLVPGYNAEGKLCQLYRWIPQPDGGKALVPTPTLGHQIHGLPLFSKDKGTVYIAEGFWDGVAMWEALSHTKLEDGRYITTNNPDLSLLMDANVLAVPGVNVFSEPWLPLFYNKVVNLLYDNDHPRKHPKTQQMIAPAGYNGMKRVAQMLASYRKPPRQINFLRWHEQGYDDTLPSGFDVRDFLSEKG